MKNPFGAIKYLRFFRNWPEVLRCRNRPGAALLDLRCGVQLSLSDMPNEIWAFWSIWRERCYDRDFQSIPQDGTIIDLGANVGIFARYAVTRLVPRGKVIAVEPNPNLIPFLQANSTDQVTIVPRAVALVDGTATLYVTESSLGSSLQDEGNESAVAIPVATVSFASLLSEHRRVELLKCNAEGIEYPLLLDTPASLWDGIERLAIKYHEGPLVGEHDSRELAARITSLGYAIHRHEKIWHHDALDTGIITASRSA